MDGILLIDKPSGWTSHDVVAKLRVILKKAAGHKVKVGHTGTLDPLATGLMVVVVGSYTKRAEEFSKQDKTYDVEMILGKTSTTGDAEGEISDVSVREPVQPEIVTALQSFIGQIDQIPPAYSAIKVNGQRAYDLVRTGRAVELEARKVTIHSIQFNDYLYPNVSFTASVSSGTYIRSLVQDIGQKLGTGAYMSNLRRTSVGEFELDQAEGLANITPEDIGSKLKQL